MEAITLATACLLVCSVHSLEPSNDYTNSWVVEVRGGNDEANRLAKAHGFVNRGQVSSAERSAVNECCYYLNCLTKILMQL